MEFRVLGGLAVDDAGTAVELGGPKQRAVLAALLLELGRPVSAARLEAHVWGDDPPANPETSLQAYVSNLRRALEPDRRPREPARLLVTQPAGYALLAPRHDVDLWRFDEGVGAGVEALRAGDPASAAAAIDEALALWVGPVLPELADHPLVADVSRRIEGRLVQALEHRFEAGLALGEHASLLSRIEAAVADHPFHERLRAQLALALYRGGRQRDALAALVEARRVLVGEVGVEPGVELRDLERRILDQDPALLLTESVAGTRPPPPKPAPRPSPAPAAVVAAPAPEHSPFVGRDRELALLREAAAGAAAGSGRAAVISGEPGIGKTRLVEELLAGLSGFTVAWGRCPESGASAAYWPCIQIGRQLEGADALDAELVTSLLPSSPPGFDSIPASQRFDLHVAIADLLAAARRPLVVVIDDLQWADPASLRVIEFLAAELRRAPLLLVVTVRPVGPDASPTLIDCLGELARATGSVRLELSGLTDAEVSRWIAPSGGGEQLAAAVRDRTGGNPFFISEVLKLVGASAGVADLGTVGHGGGVPAAVQDVVRRRVSRLPPDSQQLLAVASVVGRTFDLDVLAEVAGEPAVELLDRLDPAVAAGIVDEADLPGRFEFSHALVAETLAAEVAPGRRARLHAGTMAAITHLRSTDLDGHLADLAHHAVEGMPAGVAHQAFEWSVLAARQAGAQLAHEDAAAHWERAVRALELSAPGDLPRRYDALLELGRARLRVDDIAAGYVPLIAAIDTAVALGDAERAARAAVAMSVDGLWQAGEVAASSAAAVEGLESALAIVAPEPSAARATILGTLAENAYWLWPADRLDRVTAESVAVAREVGDPAVLARCLHKRNQVLWKASTFDLRAEASDELVAMTETTTLAPEVQALAHLGAAGVSWERADALGALAQVARARGLVATVGAPALQTQLDYFLSALYAFGGRLDEAEAVANRAHELYRRTRRWNADAIHVGNLVVVLVEQDRTSELDAVAHHLLESEYRPWFQEGYAYALALQGRLDDAAALVDGQLPPLVDSWMYLGVLGAATNVRAMLGDVDGATSLADHLAPFAGRLATAGTGPAFGDVHGALSVVARLQGDLDSARWHADRSVEVLRRAGAGPFVARALLHRADLQPASAAAAADDDRRVAAELIERLDLRLLRRQQRDGTLQAVSK